MHRYDVFLGLIFVLIVGGALVGHLFEGSIVAALIVLFLLFIDPPTGESAIADPTLGPHQ